MCEMIVAIVGQWRQASAWLFGLLDMVCDEQLRGLPYGKARVAYVFLVYWVTREYLVYMGWRGQYLAFSGPIRSGNFHPARPGLDKFADGPGDR